MILRHKLKTIRKIWVLQFPFLPSQNHEVALRQGHRMCMMPSWCSDYNGWKLVIIQGQSHRANDAKFLWFPLYHWACAFPLRPELPIPSWYTEQIVNAISNCWLPWSNSMCAIRTWILQSKFWTDLTEQLYSFLLPLIFTVFVLPPIVIVYP